MARKKTSPKSPKASEKIEEIVEDAVVVEDSAPAKEEADAPKNDDAAETVDEIAAEDAASAPSLEESDGENAPNALDEAEAENPEDDADDSSDPQGDDEGSQDTNSQDEVDDLAQATIEEALAPADPPVAAPKQKSVFVPMLLGGIICAGLGFGAATYLGQNATTSQEALNARITELEGKLAATLAQSETANSDIAQAIETLKSDTAAAVEGLDLDARIAPLAEGLEGLQSQLTALEARPVAEAIVSPEATAAYETQLAEMRTLLEGEIARLEAAQAAAMAQEASATAATVLADLKARIDSGEAFAAELAAFDGAVPEVLTASADTGVEGIAALQDAFAPIARETLTTHAKAAYDAGDEGWFSTFTRTQLGLRSLTPKEGDDVDAILSRAEAEIREADFAAAIEQLSALPEGPAATVAPWVERATARVEVMTALSALLNQ